MRLYTEKSMRLWGRSSRTSSLAGVASRREDEVARGGQPNQGRAFSRTQSHSPGAPLARLELRVLIEELLSATTGIEMLPGMDPVRATYPGSGYTTLPLIIR